MGTGRPEADADVAPQSHGRACPGWLAGLWRRPRLERAACLRLCVRRVQLDVVGQQPGQLAALGALAPAAACHAPVSAVELRHVVHGAGEGARVEAGRGVQCEGREMHSRGACRPVDFNGNGQRQNSRDTAIKKIKQANIHAAATIKPN